MSIIDGLRQWAQLPRNVAKILSKIEGMSVTMADVSQMLNEVAEGLRGPLATSLTELLAENAQLRGEDEGESAAAQNVRAAFDELAGRFQAEPSVPDVEPLPAAGDDSGAV